MIQVFNRRQLSIKRYRSKTLSISPLALRENQFFHTFSEGVEKLDFGTVEPKRRVDFPAYRQAGETLEYASLVTGHSCMAMNVLD
jgi:hypothetical protein